jgi:hypothetical protein
VDVEKFVKELDLYQCRLHEKVGLYKAECIKVIKRQSPMKKILKPTSFIDLKKEDD